MQRTLIWLVPDEKAKCEMLYGHVSEVDWPLSTPRTGIKDSLNCQGRGLIKELLGFLVHTLK